MVQSTRWNYQASAAAVKHDYSTQIIDKAWDTFSDYIGSHRMKTPISVKEFEKILKVVDRDGSLSEMKDVILHSFRYDSYQWPIVER